MTQRINTSSLKRRKSKKKHVQENYSLYTSPQVRKKLKVNFHKAKEDQTPFTTINKRKRLKLKEGKSKLLKSNLYKIRKKAKAFQGNFSLYVEHEEKKKYIFKPSPHLPSNSSYNIEEFESNRNSKRKKKKKKGRFQKALTNTKRTIKNLSEDYTETDDTLIPTKITKNALLATNASMAITAKTFSLVNRLSDRKTDGKNNDEYYSLVNSKIKSSYDFTSDKKYKSQQYSLINSRLKAGYSFISPKLEKASDGIWHKNRIYRISKNELLANRSSTVESLVKGSNLETDSIAKKLDKSYNVGKLATKATTKIATSTASTAINTSTKVLEANLSEEAQTIARQATSALKFAGSALKSPKQIHKHFYKESKNAVKGTLAQNISSDVKEATTPAKDTIETVKHSGKLALNTAKTAYSGTKLATKPIKKIVSLRKNHKRLKTLKIAKNTARGTLAVGKAIALMIKIKKIIALFLKATVLATKLATVAVKAVAAIAKILAKAVVAIVAALGIKIIVGVVIIVGVILATIFLIFGFIATTIPDADSEQLSGYINLIRELDSGVNTHILEETEFADEVIFISKSDYHDSDVHSRMNTNLHQFFAMYAVYFDGNWSYAEDNIRSLHYRTFTLTINFEECFDNETEEYIERAIVRLHIYTLEEMMDNLNLTEEQQDLLLYIIENRNLQQFFPELYDYFFGERLHGL